MNTALKFLGNVLKWIVIIGIILFAIATFMGKSYLQTFILLLIAFSLAWWPGSLAKKWKKGRSLMTRILIVAVLLIVNFVFFKPEPKTSIYLSEGHRENILEIYDQKVGYWPDNTKDIYIQTRYGKVHVLACGQDTNSPLIMIHAASMGAHSWEENLDPLLANYRIYSIDNIGEGNKSELNDVLVYPNNQEEIADFYALIADSLGVDRSPVFGASNGGFIAMSYAWYYPERVESLALFGPMGLTQLTGNSFFMLGLASMYPFQFVRNYVAKWALGNDSYVDQKYGDWFNSIMKGTIPSVARPVPLTAEQKKKMDQPVLLFLGTEDAIVGDAEFAELTARDFPNIQIEVLESGHLIAVEHADYVNERIRSFLAIN